jgi:methyl-accepting chemotaxis protein
MAVGYFERFRSRILLTHKIAVIGATGVLGVIIVGAIYLFGAAAQDGYRRIADDAQGTFALATQLYVNLLESRRAEKDFLLRSDMKYVERHGALDKSIRDDIDTLRQRASTAGLTDLTQKIDIIASGFRSYSVHFQAVADAKQRLGLNENLGLEGALRGSVHAIETKLNELKEPRLLVTMLMMRRHEKDFMLRRDAKYGGDMKKRASEMLAGVEALDAPLAVKEDIKQKLAAYQRDFFAWLDEALKLAQEQKLTSDAFAAIEPQIDSMLAAVKGTYSKADTANQVSRADTKLQMQIAIALVAIVVCAFAFWIGRLVSRPVTSLTRVMGELAQGRNEVDVGGTQRGDEIGQMARAVLVFRDAAVEKSHLEEEAAEQRRAAEEERRRNAAAQAKVAAEQAAAVEALAAGLARISEGDLRVRLDEGFTDTYRQIRDDFNTTVEQLHQTIQAIAASTREVAGTAFEISSSTTDLSQRTEEQAAGLEETSASMEQISATVKKNAENAQQASQFAVGTREVADRGGEVVARAVSAMARIEESSREISDIISVIDEIARQTNLLALNAAVEAARAGEAGRGFAVVASEVRSLAQRSSQAAKDIKDLITNSSGQVQEGVELVNKAGDSLTEITDSIKRVVEIVSEIASASGEQSTGIDQVNSALTNMDQLTQQNSALVEENAAAAKALEQQSQAMDERVSFFRVGDMPATETARLAKLERPAAGASRQPAAAPKRHAAGR